jgi:hypothetical protein
MCAIYMIYVARACMRGVQASNEARPQNHPVEYVLRSALSYAAIRHLFVELRLGRHEYRGELS